MGFNALQAIPGMKLGTLYQVLRRNGWQVDTPYLGRLGLLVLLGLLNSALARLEEIEYGPRIRATRIENPPLFIIGHLRSGTTYLHHLLSHDEHFDSPSAYQAMFPHHFCSSQKHGYRIFDKLAPHKRPMDNVPLRAWTPHEDEFALAALCAVSPYIRFLFPRTEKDGCAALAPQRLPPEALDSWKTAMLHYLKKLCFWKDNKRILLKSPPHSARIPLLLELFPGAQFIHIVRNPFHVFASTRHFWRSAVARIHLQGISGEMVDDIILSWYMDLLSLVHQDSQKIPPGALHELKFEDLERDPLQTLGQLYETLNLPGFDRLRQALRPYLKSLEVYEKNAHRLDEDGRQKVLARCRRVFEWYDFPL